MNFFRLSLLIISLLMSLSAHAVYTCQALFGFEIPQEPILADQSMIEASRVSTRISNSKYDIDQIISRELKPEASREKIDQAVHKIFDKLIPLLELNKITYERRHRTLVITFPKKYVENYLERSRLLSGLHPLNRLAYHLYHRFGVEIIYDPVKLKSYHAGGLYDPDAKQIVTSLNSLLDAKIDTTLVHEVRHAYLSYLENIAKINGSGALLMATEFETGNPTVYRSAPPSEKLPGMMMGTYDKYLRTDELMSHLGDLYSYVGSDFRKSVRPLQGRAQEVLNSRTLINGYKQKQNELGISENKRKLASFLVFLGLQKILPQTHKLKALIDAAHEYNEIEKIISENQDILQNIKSELEQSRLRAKKLYDANSSDYKWKMLESLLYAQKTILDHYLAESQSRAMDPLYITEIGQVEGQAFFDSATTGIRVQNDKYQLNIRALEGTKSLEITGSIRLEGQSHSMYNGEKSFKFFIHSAEAYDQLSQTIMKLHSHGHITKLFRERSFEEGVALQEVSLYLSDRDIEQFYQVIRKVNMHVTILHAEITDSYELIKARTGLINDGNYEGLARLVSKLRENFLKLYYPKNL